MLGTVSPLEEYCVQTQETLQVTSSFVNSNYY